MSEKIVLMVGPSPEILGGVSTSVKSILESNLKEKYNINFFETGKGLHGNMTFPSVFYRTIMQFINFLKITVSKNIKIVHIHTSSWGGFWRFVPYILLTKLLNIKILLHIHGAEFKLFFKKNNYFFRWLIKAALESTTYLIVLSKTWRQYFETISPSSRQLIIENAVHIPDLSQRNIDPEK